MALPLDLTGTAPGNRVVDEVRATDTLNKRYILPLKGTFFLKSLRVYNNANGKLLEPLTQYNTLELNIAAGTRAKDELACMIYVSDTTVSVVRLEYQAVGGEYEDISALAAKIPLYINDTSSNIITETIASPNVQVPPNALLGREHNNSTGEAIYQQLATIAEAIEGGDPGGVQMVYKFLIDYRQQQRNILTQRLTNIRSQLDALFAATEIVQGQYIFTREYLNPKLYLGYGQFVKDSEMLFYSGPATNPAFGSFSNVSGDPGLVATRVMAYRRDDNATTVDFTLTSNKTSVNEGDSVTFTLTTSGLASGTLLPYTISGVTQADIVQPLTGNFTIGAGGIATVTINIVADEVTDGAKRLTIRLTNIPEILKSVDINDTSTKVSYQSWFSSDMAGNNIVTSINEGTTAYLQLRTTSNTERLYYLRYDDSTIEAADFTDGVFPNVTARFTNTMTIPFNMKTDFKSEGNEVLAVNLCLTNSYDTMLTRTILQVIDSSKTPTCNVFFTTAATSNTPITQANEGTTAYLRLQTTNIPNNTVLNLVYSGSTNSSDFSSVVPATVNIVNNEAYIVFNIRADKTTEGDETIGVAVNHLGVNLANTSLLIKDTSTNPSIAIKVTSDGGGNSVVDSFNVPGSIYINLATNEFANGTVVTLDFRASHPDLLPLLPAPTMNVVVNNNAAWYYLTILDNNNTITQDRTLTIQAMVGNTQYSYTNITVKPRVYATVQAVFVNMNDSPISSVNEGTSFRLKVTSTNVLNTDPPLDITYTGSMDNADFISARATTVKITNGVGYVDFTAIADNAQEGNETMTAVVTTSVATGSAQSSATMTVLDTSVPAISARFTSDAAGNTTITQINEGVTCYLHITTTGYTPGTRFDLVHTGTVNSADLLDALPTYVDVSGGRAVVAYRWNEDWLTEGDETLNVAISYNGISLGSTSITVKDTSVAGVTYAHWSLSSNASTDDQYFNEGQYAFLSIWSNGFAVGTPLTLTYAANSTLNADDFEDPLPTTVSCNGRYTIVQFRVRTDLSDEGGTEFMNVTVRGPEGGSYSAAMFVLDTSKYAVSQNASTATEFIVKPGERFFYVVQGGGGSGGRTLNKSAGSWALGDGDGTRGNSSYLSVQTISDPPVTVALEANSLGGGKGRGMVNGGFGTTSNQWGGIASRRILAEPGGAAWAEWQSTGSNLLERTGIISVNGMDGGAHCGDNTHGRMIEAGVAGSTSDFFDMMDFSYIPNGAILKSLMYNCGNGGGWTTTGSGVNPRSIGVGGSAGGFNIGIFKNISNQNLKCVIRGGEAAFTNNTDANGGPGEPGPASQPGFVFVTRVDDNFTYTRTNSTWQIAEITVVSEPITSQTSGNGTIVDIPAGKRLIATAITGWHNSDYRANAQIRDRMPVISFFVKQANGKTYSGPAAAPWVKSNIGIVDERIVDVDNVFNNYFSFLRVKSTSATANGDATTLTCKPLSYRPATINYQDGIGINDYQKYYMLQPQDMDGLFYGANFGGATYPPGTDIGWDAYGGHTTQGAMVKFDGVDYRTQGGSAISMVAENPTGSTMRLIFYSWNPIDYAYNYMHGRIRYTLVDL